MYFVRVLHISCWPCPCCQLATLTSLSFLRAVSVGVIGAAAFAASKLDSGFGKFMNEGLVKVGLSNGLNSFTFQVSCMESRGLQFALVLLPSLQRSTLLR